MILGVYWYFEFPTGLYEYNFFQFKRGLGGHADTPAELEAQITVGNPEFIIMNLRELVDAHEGAFLFIERSEDVLKLGTGGYQLHDFEFELILKVEQVLKKGGAKINTVHKLENAERIRLTNQSSTKDTWPHKSFFQIVGSPLRKFNAETAAARFDCNIACNQKEEFLSELAKLVKVANIHVLFYLDKKCNDSYNLMLFFTNGRQGMGLTPKQHADMPLLEKQIEYLLSRYELRIGHLEGYKRYPDGKYKIVNIVDEEFIIG